MKNHWRIISPALFIIPLFIGAAACNGNGGGQEDGDGEDVVDERDVFPDQVEDVVPDLDDVSEDVTAEPDGMDDIRDAWEDIEIGESVTVNVENVITSNVLGLGTQLENRIVSRWVNNPAYVQLASDANIKLVRFFEHRTSGVGGICSSWDAGNMRCRSWDWEDIDDVVENIFESGGEPLIVLGFYSMLGEDDRISSIPQDMPIDPATAYPPDHRGLPYADHFAAYCGEWVRHFNDKGSPWNQVRYYEIINEPNQYFEWGDYADEEMIGHYMNLYNAAALAMKAENPNVMLGNDNCLFKKVMDYFIAHGEDLDFLSYHSYATGDYEAPDAEILDAAETKDLYEDRHTYGVIRGREVYFEARGLDLPVLNTEYNVNWRFGSGSDPRMQQIVGAVYVALQIRTNVLFNISSSVYFHFMSSRSANEVDPTGGFGFGMVNSDDDLPWFPYFVYRMVGPNLAVGDDVVESESTLEDVRSLAWINSGRLNILLVNRIDEERTIHVLGVTGEMSFFKIDDPAGTSYPEPEMQEGTIYPPEPITMDGYAVMVLQKAL